MTTLASTSAAESSRVVEVEQRLAVHDAARHRRHRSGERRALQRAVGDQPRARELERDLTARDGGAARAAVGLEDVAVDVDGALAQGREVDDAAQGTADQALDLDRAPVGAPARDVALLAVARRGGSIPYSAVSQPRPLPASHFGTESTIEAVQMTRVSPAENSADPVALRTNPGSTATGRSSSAARPWERSRRHQPCTAAGSSTCSTSPSGIWRKRVPSSLNGGTSPVHRKR